MVEANDNFPKISVVMSVFNTKQEYLQKAIDSILNQSFQDFEFIIIDDASDFDTKDVLHSIQDGRVRIITNKKNVGLTTNLNKAFRVAKGKYIARMDADDISSPQRLERCYEYMEDNPEINVLGAYVKWGNKIQKSYGSINREARRTLFLKNNAGPVHPVSIVRKSFIEDNGLYYDEFYKKAQDYDLWSRCIEYTDIIIYPEVLLEYRVHDKQVSQADRGEQDYYSNHIKASLLKRVGTDVSQDILESFVRSRLKAEMRYIEYRTIVNKLIKANERNQQYDTEWFRYVMTWYLLKYIKYNKKEVNQFLAVLDVMRAQGINYLKCEIVTSMCKSRQTLNSVKKRTFK